MWHPQHLSSVARGFLAAHSPKAPLRQLCGHSLLLEHTCYSPDWPPALLTFHSRRSSLGPAAMSVCPLVCRSLWWGRVAGASSPFCVRACVVQQLQRGKALGSFMQHPPSARPTDRLLRLGPRLLLLHRPDQAVPRRSRLVAASPAHACPVQAARSATG